MNSIGLFPSIPELPRVLNQIIRSYLTNEEISLSSGASMAILPQDAIDNISDFLSFDELCALSSSSKLNQRQIDNYSEEISDLISTLSARDFKVVSPDSGLISGHCKIKRRVQHAQELKASHEQTWNEKAFYKFASRALSNAVLAYELYQFIKGTHIEVRPSLKDTCHWNLLSDNEQYPQLWPLKEMSKKIDIRIEMAHKIRMNVAHVNHKESLDLMYKYGIGDAFFHTNTCFSEDSSQNSTMKSLPLICLYSEKLIQMADKLLKQDYERAHKIHKKIMDCYEHSHAIHQICWAKPFEQRYEQEMLAMPFRSITACDVGLIATNIIHLLDAYEINNQATRMSKIGIGVFAIAAGASSLYSEKEPGTNTWVAFSLINSGLQLTGLTDGESVASSIRSSLGLIRRGFSSLYQDMVDSSG